ncbi:nebulette-like [Salvelinus sp. IW2-2015]|uniref:nebulette-like n=1 Tax=Salvelinus sp. IW2-2015 TaxID=2691554 RepID=UPI0038D3E509
MGKGMEISGDVLERQRAKKATELTSQVKYRDGVGSGTEVMETVDMERVRRNQENISLVKYKKQLQATSVGVTPELERVRQNQENISSASHIGCI